ncbi:MAG TPA: NAD-dependent epimerase/dehydratase family protein [Solirubrobacterales bacterium]|nr:NAD-dependent epimerase/dehydratase family protein [Solirubrobacterales bacterium]
MRYLITGGSGYLGSSLVDELAAREETELIVIVDVKVPKRQWPKTQFVTGDVRDRAATRALLEQHKIDVLVHLAFLLNPIHDEALMYDVDVNGTHATLWAASEAGTQQVLVTSSATAYGAWPDNPKPIAEDWPVRGSRDFSYARHKTEADRVCQLWASAHPDRVMTIVRPCIVFGPNVDNFISRAWEKAPFFPLLDGHDEDLQLVHEDDVKAALFSLLDAKAEGAFNLAGDGTITWRQSAEMIGQRIREVSLKNMKRFAGTMWRLRLPNAEAPAGNLDFIRYPWVVSNEKLKSETGWTPRFDTLETFKVAMRTKGLVAAEPSIEVPRAPVA